jgi:F-type H+-transporting ATPase subunit b
MSQFIISIFVTLLPAMALAAGAEHGGHHGNPSPDKGLIWAFLNAAVLFFILFKVAKQPTKDFFAARAKETAAKINEAKKVFDRTNEQFAQINGQLKNASKETADLMATVKAEGQTEKTRLIEAAKQLSVRLTQDAGRIVEQDVQRAKAAIRAEVVKRATEQAAAKIKSSLSADDQVRLSHEFVTLMKKAG